MSTLGCVFFGLKDDWRKLSPVFITVCLLALTPSAQALTISNLQAKVIKTTSVVIYWETDEPAYGQVTYGPNSGLENQTALERLSYWHEVELTGLTENQTCSYRVLAQERKGERIYSQTLNFRTLTQAEEDALVAEARADHGLPKTYYVSPSGSDDNDGLTAGTAFITIQKAADTVDAGDTCIVLAGIYREQIDVFGRSGIPTHRIRFMGEGWPEVHSNTTSGYVFGLRRNYISIEGFKLYGDGPAYGIKLGVGGSGASNAQHWEIVNNMIYTDDPDGLGGHAIFASVQNLGKTVTNVAAGIIRGNTIVADGGAIVRAGLGPKLLNLKIENNLCMGAAVGDDGGGTMDYAIGFYSLTGKFVDICGNTLAQSGWTGMKIQCEKAAIGQNVFSRRLCHNFIDGYGPSDIFFYGNTVRDMDATYCTRIGDGWSCSSNLIYNSGSAEDQRITVVDTTIDSAVGRAITLGGSMHDYYGENIVIRNFNGRPFQIGTPENPTYPNEVYSSRNILFKNIRIESSTGYSAVEFISLGTCTSSDHKDYAAYVPDNVTFINPYICDGFDYSWHLATNVAYEENYHFDGTVFAMNPNKTDAIFTKAASGTHNGRIIFYYYADVQVVDKNLIPVGDAKVTFACNASSVYAKNLTPLTRPFAGETQDIRFVLTGQDGHTALPSNESATAAIAGFMRTRTQTTPCLWTITAEKNGVTASVTVRPDSSWYRLDPETPVQTTVITLPVDIAQTYFDKLTVYPNPCIRGVSGSKIRFSPLPVNATLRIYQPSGSLVQTFRHEEKAYDVGESWDVSKVAAGVYLYSITYPGGRKSGKVSVVK